MEQNNIVVFGSRKIRRTWHNDEWYFSVVDVCGALTERADAGTYWRKLKQGLKEEGSEVVIFCHGLIAPILEAIKSNEKNELL
ncbi:MAG: ATPase [Nitrospirae bacterium]|nr:ATPase [Nitrospirota bacterium]